MAGLLRFWQVSGGHSLFILFQDAWGGVLQEMSAVSDITFSGCPDIQMYSLLFMRTEW